MRWLLFSLSLCALADSHAQVAHRFQVAPHGDDAHPGSEAEPLASLQGARDRVRLLFSTNGPLAGDVEVLFAPGEYSLTNNLTFSTQDSGRDGHRVIYRSAGEPGSTVFVGAPRLVGWTAHSNGIWKLTNVTWTVGSLYDNGRRAWKARFPDRPTANTAAHPIHFGDYLQSESGNASSLVYKAGQLDPGAWTLTSGAEVVHWNFSDTPAQRRDWGMTVRALLAVDSPARRLQVNPILTTNGWIGQEDRYFVQGVPELLDQPGEFFHDAASATLYYLPLHGDPNESDLRAPAPLTLLNIVGGIEALASNITLSGFTFRYTRYGEPDPNALHGMVRLQHAENIVIEACRFANAGSLAIFGQARLRHSSIRNCWIERAGMGGILLLNAYNRWTQPANRLNEFNIIENCLIHDIGEEPIHAVYNGGVMLFNVNNVRVSHCEMFNAPRYGVTLRGHYNSENLVPDVGGHPSFNNEFSHLLIHRVGSDSGDMGAIHGASLSAPSDRTTNLWRHLVVREVYAHPSMQDHGPNGIFMDHPLSSEYQRFEHIDIARVQAEPFRGNQNPNQHFTNCSWLPDYDEALLHRTRIGLLPGFPFPRTAAYWTLDQALPTQADQVGNAHVSAVTGTYSALKAADPVPRPEPGPFRHGRAPALNAGSLERPILDGGVRPEVEMADWKSFTLEGWMRVDDNPTQDVVIATTRHGAAFAPDFSFTGWHLVMNVAGQLIFLADDGPHLSAAITPDGYIDGQWHHVAAVWDHDVGASGHLRLYVDGVRRAETPGLGGLSQNNRFAIGARKTTSSPAVLNENRWPGRLDEFRLSRAALGPDDFLNALFTLDPPDALSVTNITGSSAALTWRHRSLTETEFKVFVATNDPRPELAFASTTATGLTLSNLTSQTHFHVWVQAVSAGGTSRPVATVFRTRFGLHDKPGPLRASRANGILEVTWEDDFAEETGFVVERAIGSPDGFSALTEQPADSTRVEAPWTFDTRYFFRVAATSSVDGLRSAWSDVLEVPPWSVLDVPSVHFWYDAAGLTNDGPVSAWPDQSTNHFHLLQTNEALRPAAVTAAWNGLPLLRFSPTNWLAATNGLAGRFGADPFTLIAVYSSPAPARTVMAKGSFGGNGDWELGQQPDQFRWGSTNYLGRARGDLRVRAWSRTATEWRAFEAGVHVTSTSADATASFTNNTPLYVGRRGNSIANPLAGDIAELIAIRGPLASTNFSLLHAYLRRKWFLPDNPGMGNLGATAVTNTSASLHADVSGFLTNVQVTAYWGPWDAGTNETQWARSAAWGTISDAWRRISLNATNLTPGLRYFAALCASNGHTRIWTQPSFPFTAASNGTNQTARSIPHWWWRAMGVTNDFDAMDEADADGDGAAGWEEFWAGTHPGDAASRLRVVGFSQTGLTWRIHWQGGVYGPGMPWSMDTATELDGAQQWITLLTNSIPNNADDHGWNTWELPLLELGPNTQRYFRPRVIP